MRIRSRKRALLYKDYLNIEWAFTNFISRAIVRSLFGVETGLLTFRRLRNRTVDVFSHPFFGLGIVNDLPDELKCVRSTDGCL